LISSIPCDAAGERHDRDAGLLYLNARYMDPELGMFLQPVSIAE